MLKGGESPERGVSLRSAARVEGALARLGHEVVAIEAGADLVGHLRGGRPDAVFVALRGGGGDGTVQELLEILGIPYTGPDAGACGRCTDKAFAKHELRGAGVPTPDWFALNETAFREFGAADALGELERRLDFPLVVKPSRGSAALGAALVSSWYEVPAALVSAFDYDDRVLLERFVSGRELSIGLLAGRALPTVGPAAAGAAAAAQAAYKALGCAGLAQVELILDGDGAQVIEVDPLPDLAVDGLLPSAAAAAGIDFEQLVGQILESALDPAAA